MSCLWFFLLMIRRPPRSTQSRSSAASDVYKRQESRSWVYPRGRPAEILLSPVGRRLPPASRKAWERIPPDRSDRILAATVAALRCSANHCRQGRLSFPDFPPPAASGEDSEGGPRGR